MSDPTQHPYPSHMNNNCNNMGPPNETMAAMARVEMLEKTLSIFRAEVDMKLKIMQQILTTRNEQVSIQKRLLDREQTLYKALLSHWENTTQLAETGISVNLSANPAGNSGGPFDLNPGEPGGSMGNFSSTGPGPKQGMSRRGRKRKAVAVKVESGEGNNYPNPPSSSADDQEEEHEHEDAWNPSVGFKMSMKAEGDGTDNGGGNMEFGDRKRERAMEKERKRGEGYTYNKVATFPTFDEASDFLKAQDIWTRKTRTRTSEGEKIYYCCKHSYKCAARLYVLCDSTGAASIFQTSDSHNHVEKVKKWGLPDETRWRVNQLLATGVTKPKAIISHLTSIGIQGPPLTQLNSYLVTYRRKRSGFRSTRSRGKAPEPIMIRSNFRNDQRHAGPQPQLLGHPEQQSSSSPQVNEPYGEEDGEDYEFEPPKVNVGGENVSYPVPLPIPTPSTSYGFPPPPVNSGL